MLQCHPATFETFTKQPKRDTVFTFRRQTKQIIQMENVLLNVQQPGQSGHKTCQLKRNASTSNY